MEFLLTVYLAKKCLPRCLLDKQRKCVSLSEDSKTLGIYEKPVPLNPRMPTHNATQSSIIPSKTLL